MKLVALAALLLVGCVAPDLQPEDAMAVESRQPPQDRVILADRFVEQYEAWFFDLDRHTPYHAPHGLVLASDVTLFVFVNVTEVRGSGLPPNDFILSVRDADGYPLRYWHDAGPQRVEATDLDELARDPVDASGSAWGFSVDGHRDFEVGGRDVLVCGACTPYEIEYDIVVIASHAPPPTDSAG